MDEDEDEEEEEYFSSHRVLDVLLYLCSSAKRELSISQHSSGILANERYG